MSTLVPTTGGRAATAPPAEDLPTAHAVHLDDLEKNISSSLAAKAGAVATAHPVGTAASANTAGGASMPSGKTTSLAAGAAVAAAAAAGVAALAGHNKNRKAEDHSLPKVGRWIDNVESLADNPVDSPVVIVVLLLLSNLLIPPRPSTRYLSTSAPQYLIRPCSSYGG